MINASDLNIANINGKQIIIATKSFLSQNPQNMVFQGANCSKLPNNKQTITFNKVNHTFLYYYSSPKTNFITIRRAIYNQLANRR